jgi:hypothetical protein
MLEASPVGIPLDLGDVAAAIDASLDCAQSCTSCASSDLWESDVDELRTCIALCLTCADLCEVTTRILSRPAPWDELVVQPLLAACVRACETCAEECRRHAEHHRHCAICAETCMVCVQACRVLLDR